MAAAVEVRVEAPETLEDELVAELWALGSSGSWSEPGELPGRIVVHGFFAEEERERLRAIAVRLGERPEVSCTAPIPVEERDWLAEWRRGATPIDVGRRFRVDPREPDAGEASPAAGERQLLRLPARTAFGTGSHESTRLAVELLEDESVANRRVLDVGTGSGILSFVALRSGARQCVACDLDPAAALLLPALQRLNGERFPAWAGTLAALGPAAGGRFDLALVNVVPGEIAADLPALAAALSPGGRAIFSGVPTGQAEAAARATAEVGLHAVRWRRDGEWSAFVAERRS